MLPSIRFLPLLLTILCPTLNSQELKLGLTPIQGVVDQQNPDVPYSRFVDTVRQDINTPIAIEYMQSDRAIRLFDAGKLDCVFPTMRFASVQQLIEFSDATNGVALHLFSLDKSYRSLSELEHKLVVYLRGYEFTEEALENPNVDFFSASEHKLAMEMLRNGRASAYLAYFPDIRLLPGDVNSQLKYAKEAPLYKSYDSFMCSNSQASKHFLQQVNKLLEQLKTSGELKSILGNYYEPVPNSN